MLERGPLSLLWFPLLLAPRFTSIVPAVPFLGAAMKDGATKGGRTAFKGKQFTSTVPRIPAAAGEGLFSKKTYEYAAEPFVEAPTAGKKEEAKLGCVPVGVNQHRCGAGVTVNRSPEMETASAARALRDVAEPLTAPREASPPTLQ